MKRLFLGISTIVIIGLGGFVYRNALEYPSQPIACPLDAQVCPDGTTVVRTGISCVFPTCPFPNVTIPELSLLFALPEGYSEWKEAPEATDTTYVYTQASSTVSSTTPPSRLIITYFPILASSTALATIQQTAIGGASGMPVSVTSYTSTALGSHRFTVVSIERFEGVVDTAYYLARTNDVIRFDAIDTQVSRWTDSTLVESTLPAHAALLKLLATLQGRI